MKLKDQVAFITGSSRGIGKAIALGLAREGCNIVVTGKTDEPHPTLPGTIHDTVTEIEAIGGGRRGLAIKLDVRHEDEINAAMEKTRQEFGRIDILINNAGAIAMSPVEETPAKRFDLLMGVNVRASALCARAVIPVMKEQGSGHILMMSPPQKQNGAGKTIYALSKYGMTFVAQSLAEELSGSGIAVNALWPETMIDSQATRHFWSGQEENMRTPEVMVDACIAIFTKTAKELTGQALYDEEFLRKEGVTDFSKYAMVEGTDPGPLSRQLMDPSVDGS